LAWLENAAAGKARDTVKRYVTVMSHLWDWEHRAEDDPPTNPFDKLQQGAGKLGREAEDYLPFDDDELKKVFAALDANPPLRTVALVSLYSGMRLSECLAATKVTLDGIECWQVSKGKTKNASRIIPVHPRLADVELPSDVKASALSVAFGRMGNKLHLPPRKVFHSFRGNFATALERTGCPEEVAVRLLGHKPVSLSYGLYSAGRLAGELKGWVERVSFEL
jgi:integrase